MFTAASLLPVLDHLANQFSGQDTSNQTFEAWKITPISGGMNNLLYKIAGPEGEFAVKFTIKDSRNRAWREYHTLLALEQAGLSLAPKAIFFNPDQYPQPVVVQSWLSGKRLGTAPESDSAWLKLIEHFLAIHSFSQAQSTIQLPIAVMNSDDLPSSFALIQHHLDRIPPTERPDTLTEVIKKLQQTTFPQWQPVPPVLCRVDANTLNLIQMPDQWRSVDWENSGWGDPAFEVADIITHPAYDTVSAERWAWVINQYAQRSPDPAIAERVQVYTCFLLVWWVVRITRYIYEIPRGIDVRLTDSMIDWPVWLAKRQAQYDHYLNLAWENGRQTWGW